MTVAELTALAPSFDWARFLQNLGAPAVESLNVPVPEFARYDECAFWSSSRWRI